jgi:CRP-like cAMP-binding protein
MLDDHRWKAVAAVRDFSHRVSLPSASLPGYPVKLTKPLATLGRGACFGEMALLSNKTRSATLRARTMEVLIIPKADFNKLRQSVPAFANVFTELAAQRAGAGSPHVFADPDMPGSPPSIPTGASNGSSGQRALFQHGALP